MNAHLTILGRRPRLLALALLILLVALVHTTHAASVDANGKADLSQLRYRDGRVTIAAAEVPAAELLEQIAHAAGGEVRWLGAMPAGKVSLEIRDQPLATAVERILRGQSFLLTFDAGQARLKGIVVLSNRGDRAMVAPDAPLAIAAEEAPSSAVEAHIPLEPDDFVPEAVDEASAEARPVWQ